MTDLYRLQPDEHYRIYVGQTQSGNQFLATYGGVGFFLVLFDREGSLIEFREWEDDYPEGKITEVLLETGEKEIEFGTIQIKEFYFVDKEIGIKKLPDHLEYFLTHMSEFSEQQNLDYQLMIENWGSDFVLHLGHHHDFWCDEYGEIVAS